MKVSKVIIHNYKSICSEIKECYLKLDDKVTFIIGANESGKTNILEAMRKFSEGGFKEDDIPNESRWYGQANPPGGLEMVSVRYRIEDRDKRILKKLDVSLAGTEDITFTRCYTGKPKITLPKIEKEKNVDDMILQLKENIRIFNGKFRNYVKKYKRQNRESVSSTRSALLRLGVVRERIDSLNASSSKTQVNKAIKKAKNLRRAIEELSNPLASIEGEILNPLGEIESNLQELPNYVNGKQVSNTLWPVVPKFEFVSAEPRLWLVGEYLVDNIINKPEGAEELVSVRRLLALAELN